METKPLPRKNARLSTTLFILGGMCLLVAGWELATGLPPPTRRARSRHVGTTEPYVFLYGGLILVATACFCKGCEKDPPE